MNFVIPMAGAGKRFRDAGYDLPKMLIKARGKTLLEWSIESLPLELCTRLVLVLLREHEEAHHISGFVRQKHWCQDVAAVCLDGVTGGQAQTVLAARDAVNERCDLLVFNIDTMFVSPTLAATLRRPDIDGVLGSFHDTGSRFSFAAVDGRGYVTKTTEKVAISAHALTGLYHFRRADDFFRVASARIERGVTDRGEFYVAPMYNDLIAEGKRFVLDEVTEHWILGTPKELAAFEAAV